MPEEVTQQFFGDGIPVEVGKIQRELKKLWQEGEKVATRASRLNLVIYSAAEHSIRANTALVDKISRQHALRAILISAKPRSAGNRVRAWVNAHCQISKSGARQRCSEQIAFQLDGAAQDLGLLPNIVFSHLDSDLPLFLWWQGDLPASPDERLMSWVDRLIFDSADWARPAEQFAIVEALGKNLQVEGDLGDLNWTRFTGLRTAIAALFDAPSAQEALATIDSLEVVHRTGSRLRALLIGGWLAAQLGWTAHAPGPGGCFEFADAAGRVVPFRVREHGEAGVSAVKIHAADGSEFSVSREVGSDFYTTRALDGKSGREQTQVLPVSAEDIADLVSQELAHGGEHRVYLKVIEAINPLLDW